MSEKIEVILEDVKRHIDYLDATNQSSIRDNEMRVMYFEIERLNNIINELEKWLKNYNELLTYKPDLEENAQIDLLEEILDKIKELKENNNEGN